MSPPPPSPIVLPSLPTRFGHSPVSAPPSPVSRTPPSPQGTLIYIDWQRDDAGQGLQVHMPGDLFHFQKYAAVFCISL